MKLLVTAKNIRDAIRGVEASQIAVAYVGAGWKTFVSPDALREIVVSPTLGSNPKAIEEIMRVVGDENVYFLDRLHAKVYLGNNGAIVGSCNLSDNAMTDTGLLESAVLIDEPVLIGQLQDTFDNYKKLSTNYYPNLEAKMKRLRALTKEWNTAIWHGLARDSKPELSLMNYESKLDKIHISWYSSGNIEYDEDTIGRIVPEAKEVSPSDYFVQALQFLEEDPIEPGDWVLTWHCKNDGYPRKNGDVSWMHVHHVIPHGVVDDTYTKLVGQAKNLKAGKPPFHLDSMTKELIRNALSSGNFPALLSLDDSPWKLSPSDAITRKFLEFVRNELLGKANHRSDDD